MRAPDNQPEIKDSVLDYLQRGWSVMRLPPSSKDPYQGKSFAAYVVTRDNIHKLKEDENLAVLFNTAGSLKDFDCDFQTAADLAREVGLQGAAFGRQAVGIGHYLFNAPGCEAKKFELPIGAYPRDLPLHDGEPSRMVLEIRGNDNTYTMMPPSVHPCGEKLEWVNGRREPAAMTAAELRTLAGRHAVAAAVLYFYPEDASARYDTRMALTGALSRAGMPATMVTRYVQAVAKLADDPKWKENFAKRTKKRLQEDKPTTGMTKLIETFGLPLACAATFRDWLADEEQAKFSLGVWDAGDDIELPPPRGWLMANAFCRKFLSSLFADGAVGKSALRYAQALALATKRELTGEHVFVRCRVLIVSLEDDTDELRRRIFAARLHHNVSAAELKGWLFLSAPGGKAGKLLSSEKGDLVRGQLADNLKAEIEAHQIDVVMIDPFVKTHSVEENLNSAIDKVTQILVDLTHEYNIAVDAPHHTSKGAADPGNADKGRGASAMKDAMRLVYTLTPMSEEEAKLLGVDRVLRKSFVRYDSGKVNVAPPARKAKWFRIVGVRLGNATEIYPEGPAAKPHHQW
jgi:AAA domain/Bifunctional DNA primase/polymerase, N-terminal